MNCEKREEAVLISDVARNLIDELQPGDAELLPSILLQCRRLKEIPDLPAQVGEAAGALISHLSKLQKNKDLHDELTPDMKALARQITDGCLAIVPDDSGGDESENGGRSALESMDSNARGGEFIDFFNEAIDCLEMAESGLLDHDGTIETSESLKKVFRAFHNIKAISGFVGLKTISKVAHLTETMLVKARNEDRGLTMAESDACFEAIVILQSLISDMCEGRNIGIASNEDIKEYEKIFKSVSSQSLPSGGTGGAAGMKLGEILIKQGSVSADKVEEALKRQTGGASVPLGEILLKEGSVRKKDLSKALRSQADIHDRRILSHDKNKGLMITIESADEILESAREALAMLCDESMSELRKGSAKKIFQNVVAAAESRKIELERVLANCKNVALDMARKESVQLRVDISGGDAKIDIGIANDLFSPLAHLARNAIAHGIEPMMERNTTDEKIEGRLGIVVKKEGGCVSISVSDNGVGINSERILDRARRSGLVSVAKTPGKRELLSFLFSDTVSTQETTTEFAGRGVGMDVVRQLAVERNGSVDIKPGVDCGTIVEIKLPEYKGVFFGLGAEINDEKYAIPAAGLVEVLRDQDISRSIQRDGGEMPVLSVDGRTLAGPGKMCVAIVMSADAGEYAIALDRIDDSPRVFCDFGVRPTEPRGSIFGHCCDESIDRRSIVHTANARDWNRPATGRRQEK